MKRAIALSVIFLTFTNIFGQENTLFSHNGHLSYQDDNYMLSIILVNDLKAALDIWNVPDSMPKITQTTTTKTNEPLSLFIAYATDKDEINLTYNLKLLKPAGNFSDNKYDGLKIADTVISKQTLYTAAQLPTYVFDESDEPGDYAFIVDVYDDNVLIKTFSLAFRLEQ
jgi:hypothetical protein